MSIPTERGFFLALLLIATQTSDKTGGVYCFFCDLIPKILFSIKVQGEDINAQNPFPLLNTAAREGWKVQHRKSTKTQRPGWYLTPS